METSKWQYQNRLMEESGIFAEFNTILQGCVSSAFCTVS
jgi:hypothetical protein